MVNDGINLNFIFSEIIYDNLLRTLGLRNYTCWKVVQKYWNMKQLIESKMCDKNSQWTPLEIATLFSWEKVLFCQGAPPFMVNVTTSAVMIKIQNCIGSTFFLEIIISFNMYMQLC